jgi:bifunctional DNase/RNase
MRGAVGLGLLIVALSGCGAAAGRPTAEQPNAVEADGAGKSESSESSANAGKSGLPPRPPEGFVEMRAAGVIPTEHGPAVLLTTRKRDVLVPIFIGETEALSIDLRLRRREYSRPLTHDLLDAVLREVGGKIVSVQIDAIQEDVFVATLIIRVNEREVRLDSRASDAIALALGSKAPIFVSRQVIETAGMRRDGTHPSAEDPLGGAGTI